MKDLLRRIFYFSNVLPKLLLDFYTVSYEYSYFSCDINVGEAENVWFDLNHLSELWCIESHTFGPIWTGQYGAVMHKASTDLKTDLL